MVAEKIVLILLTHFIADSAMQPERHALKKNIVLRYMITHCLIYAGVMSLLFYYFNIYTLFTTFYFFFTHFLIDIIGTHWAFNDDREKEGAIGWMDQAFHLICLLGVIL